MCILFGIWNSGGRRGVRTKCSVGQMNTLQVIVTEAVSPLSRSSSGSPWSTRLSSWASQPKHCCLFRFQNMRSFGRPSRLSIRDVEPQVKGRSPVPLESGKVPEVGLNQWPQLPGETRQPYEHQEPCERREREKLCGAEPDREFRRAGVSSDPDPLGLQWLNAPMAQ